ncbi:hypothetical protein NM688_g2475 [Phlebia brevispora]|uniref:Uncharacterized protein n=1 Tax=Phlebia brevispora TaxID=194682 RepID=A0ACC1T8E3_9APHY|nr:hypothetical protein NM688_g2475 [Phlebia brevispora]
MFRTADPESIKDHTLYIDAISGRKRSFVEFRERIYDAATALSAPPSQGGLGIDGANGEIVGIYSHNCLDYIVLVHALLVITTPISLLSAYATPFELAHAMRTSKVTRLFVQASHYSKALKAAEEVGLPVDRIYVLEGHHDSKKNVQDLIDDVQRSGAPRVAVKPATRDTLAYLVFSSGTSGLPKAVMISHGNIWTTLTASAVTKQTEDKFMNAVPPPSPPIWLLFLPFYHTYGVHMACFRNFISASTYVVVPKWDIELVLRSIQRFAVQVLPLIPSAMHQLVNHELTTKTDLSSIVHVHSGAAYLPPVLAKKMKSFVHNTPLVFEGYGMSEQTLSAARIPIPGMFGTETKVGSVGVLIPGMEARILRPDGSDADVDEPGELWVKGGNVALGYFGNEKATKETFIDGWLRTGDTFKADKDGWLYLKLDSFVDRAKDTLKVSGAQVSPTEIEDCIRAHPDKLVVDVCVAGVSGGRTSDEKNPRAWIVLSDSGRQLGLEKTIGILDQWTRQNLSSYKWLRGGYELVDQIPKSPTGKVLRRVLQDKYEQTATRAKL